MYTVLGFLKKEFVVRVSREEWPEFIKLVTPFGVKWNSGSSLEEYYHGTNVALERADKPDSLTHSWSASSTPKLPFVEFADFYKDEMARIGGGVSMNKFEVGDKVMIRYWDDMIMRGANITPFGGISTRESSVPFGKAMQELCGRTATIYRVNNAGRETNYDLSNWSNPSGNTSRIYADYMFVLVEKAKPAPIKKKLTVAEIEKALGYGVEVVKG